MKHIFRLFNTYTVRPSRLKICKNTEIRSMVIILHNTYRLIFTGMSFTFVWAIFLPKVDHSIYFHKKKKTDETIAQSTVTIYNPEKYKESQLSIEISAVQQVNGTHTSELQIHMVV